LRKLKLSGWIYWIKFIVGILLVIIIYKKINQNESIVRVLTNANLAYVLVALMLLIPHVYVAFLKWRYLLRIYFPDISDKETFGSLLFGITLGMVTPGNIGELGRGLFFQNKSKMLITGLAVLDKISNMLIMGSLGFFSISLFLLNQLKLPNNLEHIIIISGTITFVLFWIAAFKRSWINSLFKKITKRFSQNSHLKAFTAAFERIGYKDIFVILTLTLIWFIIIIIQYHVLISGFTDVALVQSFQAVPAAIFTKMFLPFSFGGLGIREGMTVFYFSLFYISNAAVFNASLIIFFINFLIPALAGSYHVLRLNRAKKIESLPFEHLEPELNGKIKK
jgi:uncharacterized protein (TIRG00374 family)